MPIPVSATAISAQSPRRFNVSLNCPPFGIASIAFSTRLSTACFSKSRSANTSGTSAKRLCDTSTFAFCSCGSATASTSRSNVARLVASSRTSIGLEKSRNRLTTSSSRSISLSSTCTACRAARSPSRGSASFRFSSHSRIEFRGFFTSCATPAVIRPTAATRSLAVFPNRLDAHANAPRAFRCFQHCLSCRFAQLLSVQMKRFPQRMARGKDLVHAPSHEMRCRRAEKFFRGGTHHHGARVSREQQQPVFQSGHHRVQVVPQGAENFVHPAEVFPNLRDLLADQPEFVTFACKSRRGFHGRVVIPRGDAVELRRNIAQRRQRRSDHHHGKPRRNQDCHQHDRSGSPQIR